MTIGLTGKQKRMLSHVESYWQEHGVAPSVSDLAQALGLSKPTAHFHLQALERKGFLVHEAGKGRSWIPSKLIGREAERRVPIFGKVPAGTPVAAFEDVQGHVTVNARHAGDDVFALRVKGESMTGAGIEDGDVIIVRQQSDFGDGDIVVALINEEEVTVKRLHRAGPIVRLLPDNSAHEPIVVEAERVRIQGKVIGLQRDFE